MGIYFTTVAKSHICHKCGKQIDVGQKAVKTKSAKARCSTTEIYAVYCHEGCWTPRRSRGV